MAETYLIAAGVIFAVNLLPAFGPPTWAVLVVFTVNSDLAPEVLVPLGAIAAAAGRYTLATAARRSRGRFAQERLANLDAARDVLMGSRRRALTGLGLFAISPVPSGQLFVAAGLISAPLGRLTIAFFSGRLVSYSLYVALATVAEDSLRELVGASLASPIGVAVQLLMLGLLLALWRVDWVRLAGSRRHSPSAPLRREVQH